MKAPRGMRTRGLAHAMGRRIANRSAPVHIEEGASADCAAEMVLREAVSVGWLPEK